MDAQVTRKIEKFFEKYRLRHVDKNQIIIYAGDEPPGIFHLISGQVRQYDITEKGEEVVVNVFKSPAFFPMAWAINKTPNQYFYETSEPTEFRMASARDMIAFLKTNHDVTYDLLSRLYSGTNGIQRRMAHLMGGTGRSRVLFEIILECKRFGKQQKNGSFILTMHEDELARRSGLSRETINREVSKLKTMKIIDITHKEIIIKNLKRLEKELGSGL
jgi:CRP-like cAMP-binding protein